MYQDKQKIELQKLIKNREKLRDKYKDLEMSSFDKPDNNDEFIKNVLLEMWHEKFKPNLNKGTWYIPDAKTIGTTPDIEELKTLILKKKKELEQGYHDMPLLQQRAESEIKKMNQETVEEEVANGPKQPESSKDKKKESEVIGDSSEDEKDQEEIDLANMG